jgi:hypothetical protein
MPDIREEPLLAVLGPFIEVRFETESAGLRGINCKNDNPAAATGQHNPPLAFPEVTVG